MVFVGKGPDREALEEKARELGLMGESGAGSEGLNGQGHGVQTTPGAKVFFTGPIYDRDELRAWNTRADLFLFPSTGKRPDQSVLCGRGDHG